MAPAQHLYEHPPGKVISLEEQGRAFYRLVIKMFGPVWPFINVVEAEDRHARALESLTGPRSI